jgi:hypothetical protein
VSESFESRVDLLGKVPLTLTMKSGMLRLADGRLSFTRSRDRVVFDVPMREVHSVAISSFGITLWHGTTRYRFATTQPPTPFAHSNNPLVAAAALPDAIRKYRRSREAASDWFDVLSPLAGPVPLGVTVDQPWSTKKSVAVMLAISFGVVVVIGGVITAIVFATG